MIIVNICIKMNLKLSYCLVSSISYISYDSQRSLLKGILSIPNIWGRKKMCRVSLKRCRFK